jgi:opacity protein-like surface antigen
MQKTIVAALAILASTYTASAVDLPGKKAPTFSPPAVFTQTQYYVGGNFGGNFSDARAYSGGAVAGWNVLPFLAVEGTYDFTRPDSKINGDWNYGNTVAVNVLPQYKIPSTGITVYGITGAGYRWNIQAADYSIYNVGLGTKYEINNSFDIDARYRRIDSIEKINRNAEDRITAGVNYKF